MLEFRGVGVRFGTKRLKFGINRDEMGTNAEGPLPANHPAGMEWLEYASVPAVPSTLCRIDDCIGRACNGRALPEFELLLDLAKSTGGGIAFPVLEHNHVLAFEHGL